MPVTPKKELISRDFTNVNLLVKASGSNNNRAIALSELNSMRSALEAAYQAADSAQDAAVASQIADLTSQIELVEAGIRRKTVVGARFVGVLDDLNSSGGYFAGVNGAETVSIDPVASEPDTFEEMVDYCVLLQSTEPGESGIYYRSNGSGQPFVKHSVYDTEEELPAGTLIFVAKGNFANTFWLVTDLPSATGTGIIPFGQAQQLSIASGTFLTATANQLNATLNGDYFTVSGGALTLSSAFLLRITDLEDDVLALQSDVTDLQSDVSTLQSSLSSVTNRVGVNESAISALQSDNSTNIANISSLQNAMNGKATMADVTALLGDMIKPLTLTNGSYNSTDGATTFYAEVGTSGFGFRYVSLTSINSPFALQSDPIVTRENHPTTSNPALKVVIEAPAQVPDGSYEALVIVTDLGQL